uniref:Uncharacterized protein n=1 Tax=Marseillevirus sp. TaxID=2809551 RepID=A0AA96ENW0_9VIRU|nr:hypothetical protein MarDSR_489 [Marseillevirus sp.]
MSSVSQLSVGEFIHVPKKTVWDMTFSSDDEPEDSDEFWTWVYTSDGRKKKTLQSFKGIK